MVVFEGGRPKTSHYRRFQIKDVEGINDYASMQEMLRRRFRRLGEERREQRDAADDIFDANTRIINGLVDENM